MGTNELSILTTTKKSLGLGEEATAFDDEIIMHINSVLSTLHQLGVGPINGFEIEDDTQKWGDLLVDDLKMNSVKTYVHLSVKQIFDPPPNSWGATALKELIEQYSWRINIAREDQIPIDSDTEQGTVLDGGVV